MLSFYLRPLFLMVLIGLSSACSSRPKAPPLTSGATGNFVVAEVGKIKLTDADLQQRISAIEKSFPRVYSTHLQKKSLLTEMMHTELLYQQALALGLDRRYEFKSRLADLYVQDLAARTRENITEKQIEAFFEENKASVEQISARHILIRATPNEPKNSRAEKRKKLEGLLAQALKDPNKFGDLAREHSEDSSRDSGGELGYFSRKMMVAPFSEAAFKLKNSGDISPIVETQFGFHIIQLSGDRRGLKNYRDIVLDQLVRRSQKEELTRELDRLKSGVAFQVYEDNLAKLSPLPSEVYTDPNNVIPPDGSEHTLEPEKK